jgi:tRNA(Arg) A34 adenosine deaminase TadA
LQGTPIAHAELNAIASARDEVELARCELWTTHEPCSMCRAAIAFTEVAAVQPLAPDPSSDAPCKSLGGSGRSDDIWIVVANAMFLHNIAWIGGLHHPILSRNMRHSPEVVALALDLLDQ